MKSNCSFTLILMLLTMMFTACAYADSVGLSYTQIIDDRSFGLTGDYQSQVTDRLAFEGNLNAQAGDIINARLQTNLIIDVATVDLKVLVENKIKGYSVDALGREQSVGLAFTMLVDKLNVDVGIGGKNASPFSPPSAIDTLIAAGFAETDVSDRGLETLSPTPRGLPFKNGSALNAFISTGFPLGIFDVDLKGTVELAGEGDRQHQVNMNFKTDKQIGRVTITTGVEVGLMSYQDAIHYETGVVTTAGLKF